MVLQLALGRLQLERLLLLRRARDLCSATRRTSALRQAALDLGFVIHLAQNKVVGGIAPIHLLSSILGQEDR
jgi:hypothetical protein